MQTKLLGWNLGVRALTSAATSISQSLLGRQIIARRTNGVQTQATKIIPKPR